MPRAMTGPARDFRARFQRLRDTHAPGVSLEDLHYRARRALEDQGGQAVSLSTLQKRLAPGSKLGATVDLLVTLAASVAVPADEFPEYRLALARNQIDEREVGLDQALQNLERIEVAMQTRPRQAADPASAPEEANPGPPQAGGCAGRTRKAS